ncbi:Alpha/beta hydrolase family protein [Streptomyces sp. YIM 130001]|uniref:alpha/beta hydrolase n=1 Tax=Streptomyces sp. YIM 130001 TaxID=2259644 RepID=UPI000E6565C4|nr:alpha/beta fold hydrolase [Streptomyces sp. YIM 130001]RII14683.1 Alpha/beta hydrolase family protein [Streptomyces sp. YIM 130001]
MTDLHTATTGSAATDAIAATSWQPPAAIAPRGTLVLLPGRGEHARVYERFGRRLAVDGYVVHALDSAPGHSPGQLAAAAKDVLGPGPAAPVVLAGSDTGALQALHTAAGGHLTVDALLLAGTAVPAEPETAATEPAAATDEAWDAELAARTACPTHRRVLTEDTAFDRGRLADDVPASLRSDVTTRLPALVLHGAADPVSSVDRARALAARLPGAAFGTVRDGRHDVLNDITHRTAAATVVLWLERLRGGPESTPILTLESTPGT